jgi:hypothetical protein
MIGTNAQSSLRIYHDRKHVAAGDTLVLGRNPPAVPFHSSKPHHTLFEVNSEIAQITTLHTRNSSNKTADYGIITARYKTTSQQTTVAQPPPFARLFIFSAVYTLITGNSASSVIGQQ